MCANKALNHAFLLNLAIKDITKAEWEFPAKGGHLSWWLTRSSRHQKKKNNKKKKRFPAPVTSTAIELQRGHRCGNWRTLHGSWDKKGFSKGLDVSFFLIWRVVSNAIAGRYLWLGLEHASKQAECLPTAKLFFPFPLFRITKVLRTNPAVNATYGWSSRLLCLKLSVLIPAVIITCSSPPCCMVSATGSDAKFSVCACVNVGWAEGQSLSDLLIFLLFLSKPQL